MRQATSEPAASYGHGHLATYFNGRSTYWRDVYAGTGCEGAIYRDRMAAGLRWIAGLDLPAGARVLDAGCGAGWATVALADRGHRVDAVDVAGAMVAEARMRVAARGLSGQVRFQVGDVADLDLPEGAFDLVLGLGLLPWTPRPLATVKVLAQLLKPGGHLLVTADSRWCLSHLLDPARNPLTRGLAWSAAGMLRRLRRRGSPRPAAVPPAWRHSGRQVDAWIAEAGLEKRASTSVGFGPFTWFDHKLFSDSTSVFLHEWLQTLADRQLPILEEAGAHYLVLARCCRRPRSRPLKNGNLEGRRREAS